MVIFDAGVLFILSGLANVGQMTSDHNAFIRSQHLLRIHDKCRHTPVATASNPVHLLGV